MIDVHKYTTQRLATIAMSAASEIHRRDLELRETDLEAARKLMPTVIEMFRAAGLDISRFVLGDPPRHPVIPDWADEPVFAGVDRPYGGNKPTTKRKALAIARKYGDGGWMTIGEAMLFALGTGPVIERAMHKFGYGGNSPPPPNAGERKRQRLADLAIADLAAEL